MCFERFTRRHCVLVLWGGGSNIFKATITDNSHNCAKMSLLRGSCFIRLGTTSTVSRNLAVACGLFSGDPKYRTDSVWFGLALVGLGWVGLDKLGWIERGMVWISFWCGNNARR